MNSRISQCGYCVLRSTSVKVVWEITVVLDGCISLCLRESRVSNKMPSIQSHIYSESLNSCPVLFSLVLETMLTHPWHSCLGPGLRWESVILIDSVLGRDEHLAGVIYPRTGRRLFGIRKLAFVWRIAKQTNKQNLLASVNYLRIWKSDHSWM